MCSMVITEKLEDGERYGEYDGQKAGNDDDGDDGGYQQYSAFRRISPILSWHVLRSLL